MVGTAIETQQLRALFCNRFGCPESEYERRAFTKCLYWHAKLLAPALLRLNPELFAKDLEFIRYLGAATDLREASVDALNFQTANLAHPRFWRTGMKIRVSGRKASTLAHRLFSSARSS
jgi:hypothetical protein